MLAVGAYFIDPDILTEHFACDLGACGGACCVEGEGGAPLTQAEAEALAEHYEAYAHHLWPTGRQEIRKQGHAVKSWEGWETPLVGGRECVYAVFDKNGAAFCGLEMAEATGDSPLPKPISCALYPIRVDESGPTTWLRYDRWDICAGGCTRGEGLKLPLYEFLKAPLVRAFGEEFYAELDAVGQAYRHQQGLSA